jgi:hypothetical protein
MKKRNPRIIYAVNHDDVMFLSEQGKNKPGKNWPLAVYMDIYREAARLHKLWPNGNGPEFEILFPPTPTGFMAMRFNYDGSSVKKEFGATELDIFNALWHLRGCGICNTNAYCTGLSPRLKPDLLKTYRISLTDFNSPERKKGL